MKSKIIVMKNIKTKIILFISIIFFTVSLLNISKAEKTSVIDNVTIQTSYNKLEEKTKIVSKNDAKEAYTNIAKEINGYTVIGKLNIPKIKLETYVLENSNKESLNESVAKLCGPNINGVGNFCIIGHNYNDKNMFKKLKNLEIGDEIFLTDIYDQTIKYQVYDKYKVYPKETECLSQETNGEREITLITCTIGGSKRLIIKAGEIYD